MSGPAPEHEQPVGPTLEVTLRLLGRFMPGETASILLGFVLVLAASGLALLQPWPLKLVLDCVIGRDQLPSYLSGAVHALGLTLDSKLSLLLLLCLGLL